MSSDDSDVQGARRMRRRDPRNGCVLTPRIRTGQPLAWESAPLPALREASHCSRTIELVSELTEDAVPDMLDLGPDGFALDGILLFAGRSSPIDAVFAQTGRALGEPETACASIPPSEVAEVGEALSALPDDVIARHYEDARKAIPKLERGPAQRWRALHGALRAATQKMYANAAEGGHGMVTFLV